MAFEAAERASILMGETLERLRLILAGLELDPERMRTNLELSGGMISAEAIMLELGKTIGRQHAHDVVYQAAQAAVSQNSPFLNCLATDPRVTTHLNESAIRNLLDPGSHTGLSENIAREQVNVANRISREIRDFLDAV